MDTALSFTGPVELRSTKKWRLYSKRTFLKQTVYYNSDVHRLSINIKKKTLILGNSFEYFYFSEEVFFCWNLCSESNK